MRTKSDQSSRDAKLTRVKCAPLPPDPDNMNDDRAAWAGECIALMSEITGCEPGREALGDLICNLFHWGDRNGISPDDMRGLFAKQFQMYRAETMAA